MAHVLEDTGWSWSI